MHLQYCDKQANQDITGDFYAEEDATEVRAWTPDGTLLASAERDARGWYLSGSDVNTAWTGLAGHRYPTYGDALAALDVDISLAAPDAYTDATE